ncbi:hypothetical protein ACWGI8_13455, partial [Streptomyces sp. NPDC054841]
HAQNFHPEFFHEFIVRSPFISERLLRYGHSVPPWLFLMRIKEFRAAEAHGKRIQFPPSPVGSERMPGNKPSTLSLHVTYQQAKGAM